MSVLHLTFSDVTTVWEHWGSGREANQEHVDVSKHIVCMAEAKETALKPSV